MKRPRRPYTPEEIRKNQKIYTEYFDSAFTEDLVKHVLGLLDECYFRSELIGFEQMPERIHPDRPLIYASNHSGMAFPWDAIIFCAKLYQHNNYTFTHSVRALTAPMLSQTTLMNPFLLDDFWKKCGGIDATFKNFETMMHYKESNLLVYPEGVPGIGKGFNRRYQLQRFATSFIRMSIKHRTDIIPFATVNGEYINPYNLESRALNWLTKKIGIPFLPVGLITLLVPLQPWMFYFCFPARLTYVMGQRIRPYEIIDKPYEEISESEFHRLATQIKQEMQSSLNDAVAKYGRKPYNIPHLLGTWRRRLGKFPFFLPFFWPSIFSEFNRLSKKGRVHALKVNIFSGIKAFYKNPINIAFFLPLIGWIPILMRGYRNKRKGKGKDK